MSAEIFFNGKKIPLTRVVGVDVGRDGLVVVSNEEKRRGTAKRLAYFLAYKYKVLCVETLDLPEFRQFFGFLREACAFTQTELVFVDKYFPSTKKCSVCGKLHRKMSLKVREWECEYCGEIHDRDVNAAYNLRTEGLKLLFARGAYLIGGY